MWYNFNMRITIFFILFLACSLLLFPASKEKLGTINKQIDDINGKLEKLKKEEGSLLNDIYKVELQCEKAIIENNRIKIRLKDTQVEIRKKNVEKQKLENEIQKSKKNLKKILRILYKIGGNTYLKIFLRINTLDQLFENYQRFISLINYKSDEIEKIKRNLLRLSVVKTELQVEYKNLQDLQKQEAQKIRDTRYLKQSRLSLINKINNDRQNYLQLLDELRDEAARLNELIYGKRIKRPMRVINLAKIKGKLRWPLEGKVVSSFGKKKSTKFDTYIINNGIKIKPKGSDKVRVVYSGEVVFAEYYKGYGNLMIVQHSKNLHSLYGQCEKFLKKKGDRVTEGELISIAGDTGSTYGKSLYFEIRTQLTPQNPLKWLRKK